MDDETGLVYAKARFYDPAIGLFLSEDPLEGLSANPPSLHRYLYAYQNPTVYVDPDGRQPEDDPPLLEDGFESGDLSAWSDSEGETPAKEPEKASQDVPDTAMEAEVDSPEAVELEVELEEESPDAPVVVWSELSKTHHGPEVTMVLEGTVTVFNVRIIYQHLEGASSGRTDHRVGLGVEHTFGVTGKVNLGQFAMVDILEVLDPSEMRPGGTPADVQGGIGLSLAAQNFGGSVSYGPIIKSELLDTNLQLNGQINAGLQIAGPDRPVPGLPGVTSPTPYLPISAQGAVGFNASQQEGFEPIVGGGLALSLVDVYIQPRVQVTGSLRTAIRELNKAAERWVEVVGVNPALITNQ